MKNNGQVLIATIILIIIVAIIMFTITIFLNQMVSLNIARTSMAKAVYAAQAGIYKAVVDYKNTGLITTETDTGIDTNTYYTIGGGGGTLLWIDASDPTIHGGDRKLKDIDIYNINSASDAVMDAITISWSPDGGEAFTKIDFNGGGANWTGSVANGVEIPLSYTFSAGDDEEFKLEWANGTDITAMTITALFHFTDGTSKTATLLSSGSGSGDSISIKATGKVVAKTNWKRTIEVDYDTSTEEITTWKESSNHL